MRCACVLRDDWRRQFGARLPLLLVQLAGYGQPPVAPADSGWAQVREAQRRVAAEDAERARHRHRHRRCLRHPSTEQAGARAPPRAVARHVVYGERRGLQVRDQENRTPARRDVCAAPACAARRMAAAVRARLLCWCSWPGYGQPPVAPTDSGWAQVREAQRRVAARCARRARSSPSTSAMPTTSIHRKQLGRRLARVARHVVTRRAGRGAFRVRERRSRGADAPGVAIAFEDVDGTPPRGSGSDRLLNSAGRSAIPATAVRRRCTGGAPGAAARPLSRRATHVRYCWPGVHRSQRGQPANFCRSRDATMMTLSKQSPPARDRAGLRSLVRPAGGGTPAVGRNQPGQRPPDAPPVVLRLV